MAGDDGRMPLYKDGKIPVSKKKEFLGKALFWAMIVALLLAIVTMDYCFKDAEETTERIQQMKNNGKTVVIDRGTWKQTIFYDENKRCWNIYTHTDSRGKAAFATPCIGEKP